MNNKYSFGFDLFESFNDMCLILSSTGEVLELNNSASNSLERNNESLIGKSFIDLIETEYKEKFRLIFTNSVIESKRRNIFAVIDMNNSLIEVNILIIPIKTEGKEGPNVYFITAEDVTEQKKKELDLLRFYYVAENT